jgi:hypothetical protein
LFNSTPPDSTPEGSEADSSGVLLTKLLLVAAEAGVHSAIGAIRVHPWLKHYLRSSESSVAKAFLKRRLGLVHRIV